LTFVELACLDNTEGAGGEALAEEAVGGLADKGGREDAGREAGGAGGEDEDGQFAGRGGQLFWRGGGGGGRGGEWGGERAGVCGKFWHRML